jgi:hypothetical protein
MALLVPIAADALSAVPIRKDQRDQRQASGSVRPLWLKMVAP